jgi:pilus assembly protein CpaB
MHPRTPLILAAIAFLLSLGAGWYAWQTRFRTEEAVVAVRDLPAGHRLSPGDVERRLLPAGGRPAGSVTHSGQLAGKYTAYPLLKDQVLTLRHLAETPPTATLAERLPPGQRVVSVSVRPETVLGGALAPGDTVDLLVAWPADGEKQTVRVETLAAGLTVVDIRNQSGLSTREKPEYGSPGAVPHAVLLRVSPSQAQRLIAAAETKGASLYLLLAGAERSVTGAEQPPGAERPGGAGQP